MVPVCHGFGGKVPSYGSGRRDIRRRGCTVFICEACVEKSGELGELKRELKEKLREEAGVGVCVSDRVLLCVSQYQPDRFRCLYG